MDSGQAMRRMNGALWLGIFLYAIAILLATTSIALQLGLIPYTG